MGVFDFLKKAHEENMKSNNNTGSSENNTPTKSYKYKNGLTPIECAKLTVKKIIEDTKIPYVSIKLSDENPKLTDSKIGGIPYIPKNGKIPLQSDGKQMWMIAQINCEDIPIELTDFPHKGILQFWLSHDAFRENDTVVKYYTDIDDTVSEEDISLLMEHNETSFISVNGEYSLKFTLDSEHITRDDIRVNALFCQYYTEISGTLISNPEDAGDDVYDVYEEFLEDFYWCDFKMNGYRTICQLPDYLTYRPDNANFEPSPYHRYINHVDFNADDSELLLLQIASVYNNSSDYSIMIGDAGILQFHILRKDLKERNFNNVTFHADCS